MSAIGIPSVDLADFLLGDQQRKERFVQELGKAYEEVGFVAVKNHLLNDNISSKLYREVQQFFALPVEAKEKYELVGLAGQRGYTSFGKEHAKGKSDGDLKEF